MIRLIVCICTLFVSVGCGIRQPIPQFKQATITQSTPEAVAFDVTFEISNTNSIPLQLLMYTYQVSAGGSNVYSGLSSAEKTVPRSSSILSTIPVVIPRSVLLGRDSFTWQLRGTLGFIPPKAMSESLHDAGIWKPSTSVRAHGLIHVPEITD
ncbi:MAG: hypothetical protein H8E86_07745 [Planctomycetes bacterium]|nr:hypothetical protein [Planctomycetota bacterium]